MYILNFSQVTDGHTRTNIEHVGSNKRQSKPDYTGIIIEYEIFAEHASHLDPADIGHTNCQRCNNTLKKEDLLFTGDNAMGTIPNCLKLNSNKIRFIAPSPASVYFEQAFASVTEEELDNLVFLDKDESPKFKVTERGVFIGHPDRDKSAELKGLKPFWARCLIIWSKSRAKLEKEKREKYLEAVKEWICSAGSAATSPPPERNRYRLSQPLTMPSAAGLLSLKFSVFRFSKSV